MNINFELMEVKRMFVTLTSLMALSLGPVSAQAQTGTEKVNEKFHIYLCLGQSNMYIFRSIPVHFPAAY